MPRHIVDLTSSPAGRPVPPHLSLSTAKPNAPAGKRLPTNGAPATKRLPSNGTPTLTESEALEAKRKLLIDIVNDCKIDRLRTVLMDLMVKNGQMAVDWVGEALLIEEEAVKPFKEGDDDLGDSDLEISEGSDEESDEESDENDNADDEESEEEKSDQGGTPTTSKPKSSAPTTADASAGAKRMRSRYAHCINCEEEFDTTLNAPGLCVWHEGNSSAFLFSFLRTPGVGG